MRGSKGAKPTELRDAEARVRALTREVGSLREELRRESKRREWAVARSKEKEEAADRSDERCKELSYVNKKLSQELSSSQEAARTASAKNRQAIQSLKEGLADVERAVAQRGVEGKKRLDCLFTGLQTLEGLLLTPPNAGLGSCAPLPVALAPEVQRILGENMRSIAAIGNLLAGPPGSKLWRDDDSCCDVSSREVHSLEVEQENMRLRGEVTRLNMELTATAEAQKSQASTADVRNTLSQYRTAVTKLQAQVASMRERLDEGTKEKASLRDEISTLQRAIRERVDAHANEMASAEQREASGVVALQRLEDGTRALRETCATREHRMSKLQNQLDEMQAQLSEREETVVQQRAMINDLQATISNQRNDIRSAMDLIVHRPSSAKADSPLRASFGRPIVASSNPDVLRSPIFVNSPRAESPTNHHTHYHIHKGPLDASTSAINDTGHVHFGGLSGSRKRGENLTRSWGSQRKCGSEDGKGGGVSARRGGLDSRAIKRDMDTIDAEIAELDAALRVATSKFS
ncbi:hypothetical protein BSKO_01400 [Bryopsis sp. KO-2023]|nr:hypothetical protein BSKO_01400 [Bryopsis sp. KO-2023]